MLEIIHDLDIVCHPMIKMQLKHNVSVAKSIHFLGELQKPLSSFLICILNTRQYTRTQLKQ